MVKIILEKKRDDGTIIYRIDRVKKLGEYVLNSGCSQAKQITKIRLHGFDKVPSGFYANGFGLTNAGSWLLSSLSKQYGVKLRITISATLPSKVKKSSGVVEVTLNHNRLSAANNIVRGIKKDRNDDIRKVIDAYLTSNYPKEFGHGDDKLLSYRPGKIAQMLADEQVSANLSDEDKDALRAVFPSLIGEMAFSLKSASKVKIIAEGLKQTQLVYLDKIVAEYEKKLNAKGSEAAWQVFLRTHILMLLSTYAAVIEKQSVDLDGKYPDFMLVDAYGYIDVYEIKKPQTQVLMYDRSRKNYYWSPEVARAISQTEKYLSSIQQYRLDLEDKLRKKNVEAHIVRPRGFVIVGKRSDLENDDMMADFRVLNDGLKNIDLVFYDDLLDNLKALLERLQRKPSKTK
jgi:hypothetical protein